VPRYVVLRRGINLVERNLAYRTQKERNFGSGGREFESCGGTNLIGDFTPVATRLNELMHKMAGPGWP